MAFTTDLGVTVEVAPSLSHRSAGCTLQFSVQSARGYKREIEVFIPKENLSEFIRDLEEYESL